MKKIKIVSPAKSIAMEHVNFAKRFLEDNGFTVEVGRFALGEHHYFSGTDQERLSDFQAAIDDPTIDVILCARGGYGSVRIIDDLNFSNLGQKLIVGYSDITVFHNHIQRNFKVPTLHATAPLNFSENTVEALDSLLNALNGISNEYEIEHHPLNRKGIAEGKIVGGNLSILASLVGTDSDLDFKDSILFIEDIGEAIYAVDRMLNTFRKAGKLNHLKGLIVGGMTDMKDSAIPFGKTVEEVIREIAEPYSFPLCFNFPAGHINDNRAVFLGKACKLEVSDKKVHFIQ